MYHKVCVLHSSLLSLFIRVIPKSFEKESLISCRICVVCALNTTNPLFVGSHHLTMTLMLLSEVPFSYPSTSPVPVTLAHLNTGVHYCYWKDGHVQISWTALVCLWAIQMKLPWFDKEKVPLTHPLKRWFNQSSMQTWIFTAFLRVLFLSLQPYLTGR